jgi:RNA polymerase sigma factor (TIGR02999 family)
LGLKILSGAYEKIYVSFMAAASVDVTQLLLRVTDGDRAAVDTLLPFIYKELRALAASYLRRERDSHTLEATALVHEAYLRLVDQTRVQWQNRAHFFAVAASQMRRILVDYARAHGASKRGAGSEKVTLDDGIIASSGRSGELVAVDEALDALAQFDPIKARIVELRFFGGLSIEETSTVLETSEATVNRQWRLAKAWLYGQLKAGE